LTPPTEKQTPIVQLPAQPIGRELRDSFERVRNEPIPDKLKDLITELKSKEKLAKEVEE